MGETATRLRSVTLRSFRGVNSEAAAVLYWNIPDPVSMNYEKHCAVRDQIESQVMRLIIRLRQEAKSDPSRKHGLSRAVHSTLPTGLAGILHDSAWNTRP